ncbi:MAG: zinc-binding dehydrogenase [Muribaculaceae bacterium]|nr:zinc-binding dehydrogenase [Muribaculaceae bacterium]
MKAVVLTKPCSAEEMTLSDVSVPTVRPGWVLIRVRAFGINHSEVLLREFEVAQPYITKPIIPGIECVGEIADASDSNFRKGQKVMALMGGMGRSFNGSYAEYVIVPVSHVFAVESTLGWTELAAIPETYFTAYGSLSLSLQLTVSDTLLIRGGTSTVGLAALQLAKTIGAKVISTTRSERKAEILRQHGADDVITEGDDFVKRFLAKYPAGVTKVLELIGAATLHDSLRVTATHGIVCHTGLLGGVYGIKNFDPIKEIPSGVYLTGFYSNTPTQPQIDAMMSLIHRADLHPIIAQSFALAQISKAHLLAEQRSQMGKIVITV